MTASADLGSPAALTVNDAESVELRNAISQEFLASVQWSADDQILVFPCDHPVLGWRECIVPDCDQKVLLVTEGLCAACNLRWKQLDRPDLADFVRVPRVRLRRIGADPCEVAVCERTARAATGLCGAHERARKRRQHGGRGFREPARP